LAIREGRILEGKLGSIKKFPNKILKILMIDRKFRKKIVIFRTNLVRD
jgi:hypothetical protein